MQGLREEAVKLYNQLVSSPDPRIALPMLTPYLLLALIDPRGGVIVGTAPLASFAASFGSCGKPSLRRLLAVYAYSSLYAVASLLLIALGLRPFYEVIHAPLSLLPLGICGLGGLAAYTLYATLSGLAVDGVKGAVYSLASSALAAAALIASLGERGLWYARAAILAWADDKYDLLESLLSREKRRVKWRMLVLKRADGEKLGLVEPGVHYGPFRGAGSSKLPHMVFQESRGRVVALHGCGSHERNLASSREALKYARLLARSVDAAKDCTPIKPMLIRHQSWYGVLLGCFEKPMLFASCDKGVEDIPCETLEDYMDKLVYIDMHNREAPYPHLDGLNALLEKALNSRQYCESVRCCWRLMRLEPSEARRLNMCAEWLLYIRIACDDNAVELLVVPANNVEPDAADEYAKRLRNVHIVTIDDHSCVAAIEEGVAPLRYSERLVEIVKKAKSECREEACSFGFSEGEVLLTLWGRGALDEISKVIRRGVRARYVPLLIYLAPVVLLAL